MLWWTLQQLKSKDAATRKQAVEMLGNGQGKRVVEPLARSLKDPDESVRQAAAEALVRIGRAAFEPLIEMLNDADWSVRSLTVVILGRIGDPRAREPLVKALTDKNTTVRIYAAQALWRIGDTRAIELLIIALQDSNWSIQRTAAQAFGQIGDARAVEPLIALLKHQEVLVYKAAAEALGKISDVRVMDLLVPLLKDTSAQTRKLVAELLQARGWQPKDEIQHVWLSIALQNWASVGRELTALGQLGDPRAIEPLVNALQNEISYSDVRAKAAQALGQLGDLRAVEPLVHALQDWSVRRAASEALVEIGQSRLYVFRNEDFSERSSERSKTVIDSLGRLLADKSQNVDSSVSIAAIRNADSSVSIEAIRILRRLGSDHRAVEPLVIALLDRNPEVRRAVQETLIEFHWQPKDHVQEALLAISKEDWASVISLGVIAVEPLVTILAQNGVTSTEAVRALQRLLEKHSSSIDSNDLRRIATLNKVFYLIMNVQRGCDGFGSSISYTKEVLDCTLVRQLARQELIRRGLEA